MLDGHGKIERYVERAKELGQPALAITDHGNLHGWLDHYDSCVETGIKPILGVEAYMAMKTRFDRDEEERAGGASDEVGKTGPYHLTMLAQNYDGYKNLIKISSESYLNGFYVKPRVDYELIDEHSKGLIILSGCLNGAVPRALLREDFDAALAHAARMQEIVGKENYFIEVHNHGIEEQIRIIPDLVKIAKTIGAKMVAGGDCHYVSEEDAENHDILLCVSTGAKKDQENRFKFHGPEFYLKSYEEMSNGLETEWLDNTLIVNDMVDLKLDFGEYHFPKYPKVPDQETTSSYFDKLVREGIRRRYGDDPGQEVLDRLAYESRVIKASGFESYFLVVADLVNWGKDQKIGIGAGRGSAASSIVSYAMGITNIDPLQFGLMFERFLVEGRKSMPDIDLDIADDRRNEMIDYARDLYGEDQVAHICTFHKVRARMAVRDATRVLGHEVAVGDKISKAMPPLVMGNDTPLYACFEQIPKYADGYKMASELRGMYNSDDVVKEIVDAAKGIEGVHRQDSIHAAGVVIAKGKVSDYVPVMQKGEKEPKKTQWDMNRVEQCGLLKIDFLGLRNLSIVMNCYKLLRDRGIDINLDEDKEFADGLTYDLLQKGDTIGVFQLESPSMRDMALAIVPEDINDIMALISLYRPGPLGSHMDKMYINRKHGREKVVSYHEAVHDVLKNTYGLMIYQEQILSVSRQLAGFDPGESDDLRKSVGKKMMDKITLYREKFVQGCKDTHNIKPQLANKIYSDIEFFGGYGFNLAHAASYAVLAYQTAYLKAHYPTEYMAALLTSVSDEKDKLYPYLNEANAMGLEVRPPSATRSKSDFSVKGESILFGFSGIDGVGGSLAPKLVDNQENIGDCENIYQFMRSSSPAVLEKKPMEKLLYSGALDEMIQKEDPVTRPAFLELLNLERQQIGMYLTNHPIRFVYDKVRNKTTHTVEETKLISDAAYVKVAGIVGSFKRRTTKTGKSLFEVKIEDDTGIAEFIVFDGSIQKHDLTEEDFEVGSCIVVELRVKMDTFNDNTRLAYYYMNHEVIPTTDMLNEPPVHIELTEISRDGLKRFENACAIIKSNPGHIPVHLYADEGVMRHSFALGTTNSRGVDMIEEMIF